MQLGWPQPLHWSSTNWHEVTPAQGLSAEYLQNEWIYRRKALDKFNYLLITISEVGRSSLRAITQTQQSKTYVTLRQLSPAGPREWQRNSNSNGGCFPWIISVVDQCLSCHHTTETGSVSKRFWKGQLLFRPWGNSPNPLLWLRIGCVVRQGPKLLLPP